MIKLWGLVILTQKEIVQLAKEERSLGYGAGLKSKWRAKKKEKSLVTTNGIELEKVYCSDFTPPLEGIRFDHDAEGNLHVSVPTVIVDNPPTTYGDSLPVKGKTAGVTTDPDLVLPIG